MHAENQHAKHSEKREMCVCLLGTISFLFNSGAICAPNLLFTKSWSVGYEFGCLGALVNNFGRKNGAPDARAFYLELVGAIFVLFR